MYLCINKEICGLVESDKWLFWHHGIFGSFRGDTIVVISTDVSSVLDSNKLIIIYIFGDMSAFVTSGKKSKCLFKL